MTISTLALVLLVAAAVLGAVHALNNAILRGDGLIRPDRAPVPVRNRDSFDQAIRRLM